MKSPLPHRFAAGGICLKMNYSVKFRDKSVGTVAITAQGLYYCISASCDLDHNQMYELIMCKENGILNLGVLLPEGKSLILEKKLPVKAFGLDDISFVIAVRDENDLSSFVVVEEETPFAHIQKLEKAVMVRKGEERGVCFVR